jgi:hypothetical protein
VINDENQEWTDSPKHQESQTQQDYDLVHITSMRKARRRWMFFTLASFLLQPPGNSKDLTAKPVLHRN